MYKINKSKVEYIKFNKDMIANISKEDEASFNNIYNIKGHEESQVAIGLIINNEIISMITFKLEEFNGSTCWKIVRHTTRADKRVIDGEKGIIEHLRAKNNYSIVVDCNIAKRTGQEYKDLGFSFEEFIEPDYIWWKTKGHKFDVISSIDESTFLGDAYSNNKDIVIKTMESLGYLRLYDCGCIRYILK